MIEREQITIKGLHPRYKCYLNDGRLEIYNQKGDKLGSVHRYNSEQVNYMLYCEDGKRRSFYELRLMYAFTNNISVLDIPKGCIYRTRYGLEFYNKRQIVSRPYKEMELGGAEEKVAYVKKLDKHWKLVKRAIISGDLTKIADVLMEHKDEVLRRSKNYCSCAKEVLEDCFQDAVEYYIKRLIKPKYKMSICLPQDALTNYVIKRYRTHYFKKGIK